MLCQRAYFGVKLEAAPKGIVVSVKRKPYAGDGLKDSGISFGCRRVKEKRKSEIPQNVPK